MKLSKETLGELGTNDLKGILGAGTLVETACQTCHETCGTTCWCTSTTC